MNFLFWWHLQQNATILNCDTRFQRLTASEHWDYMCGGLGKGVVWESKVNDKACNSFTSHYATKIIKKRTKSTYSVNILNTLFMSQMAPFPSALSTCLYVVGHVGQLSASETYGGVTIRDHAHLRHSSCTWGFPCSLSQVWRVIEALHVHHGEWRFPQYTYYLPIDTFWVLELIPRVARVLQL